MRLNQYSDLNFVYILHQTVVVLLRFYSTLWPQAVKLQFLIPVLYNAINYFIILTWYRYNAWKKFSTQRLWIVTQASDCNKHWLCYGLRDSEINLKKKIGSLSWDCALQTNTTVGAGAVLVVCLEGEHFPLVKGSCKGLWSNQEVTGYQWSSFAKCSSNFTLKI